MSARENKQRTRPDYHSRSWPLTITSLLLSVFVIIGMVASWRYLKHDLYVVCAILVPSGIIAILLLIAALNGRKQVIKEFYTGIFEMIFWWNP